MYDERGGWLKSAQVAGEYNMRQKGRGMVRTLIAEEAGAFTEHVQPHILIPYACALTFGTSRVATT